MLNIYVKYLNVYAEVPRKQHETIVLPEGVTVQTLVDELCRKYGMPMKEVLLGKAGKFTRNMLVNGVSMHFLDGLETKLRDRDSVALSPR